MFCAEVGSAIERPLSCGVLQSLSSEQSLVMEDFLVGLLSVARCVVCTVKLPVMAGDATCPSFVPFLNKS